MVRCQANWGQQMHIPNPVRSTLKRALSVIGVAFGVLSVMKLFEAFGLIWVPIFGPVVKLGDLPGEPLRDAAVTLGWSPPRWLTTAFASYVLMGLYFNWITRRLADHQIKHAHIEYGAGYYRRAIQESVVMVALWPLRLASDLSKPIFWQLSPWYVFALAALAEMLLVVFLLSGIASFGS